MTSGKISRMVRFSARIRIARAVAVTGGGSVLPGNGAIAMRSLATVRRTCVGHAGLGVARQQTEIHRRLGVARQHVVLVAGVEDRQRGGGADHRPRSGRSFRIARSSSGLNSQRFDSTNAVEAAHFRRHASSNISRDRAADLHRQPACLPAATSAALIMPMAVSCGGIEEWPGVRLRRQHQRGVALLGDADQRRRLVEALA